VSSRGDETPESRRASLDANRNPSGTGVSAWKSRALAMQGVAMPLRLTITSYHKLTPGQCSD